MLPNSAFRLYLILPTQFCLFVLVHILLRCLCFPCRHEDASSTQVACQINTLNTDDHTSPFGCCRVDGCFTVDICYTVDVSPCQLRYYTAGHPRKPCRHFFSVWPSRTPALRQPSRGTAFTGRPPGKHLAWSCSVVAFSGIGSGATRRFGIFSMMHYTSLLGYTVVPHYYPHPSTIPAN